MELQQSLRRYKDRDLAGRVTTTDVVVNADKVAGMRHVLTGIQVWKSCSGLAHAESSHFAIVAFPIRTNNAVCNRCLDGLSQKPVPDPVPGPVN